ncbi:iron ABC transporter permease [Sulfitobacter sp. M57]|uniref:ABC transporter permease n=1 Tax=unclassified Sulfitobacter TaxID=196795 RepID=UPI0023E2BCB6|nr:MULTISPECIES: iron ABC transporter permease [unclassified Sulfitobacter]MDF3414590.1 iron ABC transporter permease [Sulfitobacter sp. KE5]MDF3422072.1 iron ABC transporter permease [Sulfitobacter sp. KE43]MDF3433137.1 iron ABC transporter permease [Sulfitobacter sp. KE42]MDF3458777.1 iron ABC transporter permease [Sulfitobacter sp. S74]MDF3462676.1 iron ABC transporter permease [Sulfitobacter sp. Ks18]
MSFAMQKGGSRSEGRLLGAILVVAICLTLAPVLRLFVEGFADQGAIGLTLASEVLSQPATLTALKHSLVTAGLGTVVSLVLGAAFAFLVALTDLRAKGALVFCLMIPMMIPPQITALSWTQIMGPSSVLLKTLGIAPPLGTPQPLYSAEGIILLLGIQHMSIIFLTLRAGLRSIPQDVVEAARISGARGLRTWWQVVMPLTLPSLAAGIAITFVTALGNFGIPAMLGIPAGYVTLPTLVYQKLAGLGTSVLAEVSVLAMLIGVVAVVGILVQRFFQTRQKVFLVGATSRPLAIPLGAVRLPVEILLWAVVCVILVLPMFGLLATSLVPAYGVPLRVDTVTLTSWWEVLFRQPVTTRAFANSFGLAFGAAFVLVVLCLPLAWLMERNPTRLSRVFDSLLDLPYALPGVVLSIAMILLLINLPFTEATLYGTIWIIFLAYLARFFAVMFRPVQASLKQLDPAMGEAAQSVGASLFQRLRDVIVPLSAPAAAAGGILVFLTAFNELTVSALLWSSGTETLGVVIFNLDDSGETAMASALAMTIVLVVMVLMIAVQLLSRRFPKGVVPWQT